MAHVSQDRKKGFQEKIKVINKKYGMRATLSVRHHSTIILTIRSGAIDFVNDLQENDRQYYDGTTHYECDKNRIINNRLSMYFYSTIEDTFKGIACDYLKECFDVLLEDHYDRSDSQIDYFDIAWYVDVTIGVDSDNPYKLISESPAQEVIKESPVIEEQQINIEIPVQEVITTEKKNTDSLKKAISRFNKSNKSDKIKVVCDTKITDRKCYLYELKVTYTNRIGNISTFTIVNNKGTYYIPVHTNNMYEQKFIELFNSKNNDDDDTLDLPFDIEVIETPLLPFDDTEKIAIQKMYDDEKFYIFSSDKNTFDHVILYYNFENRGYEALSIYIDKLGIVDSFKTHSSIEKKILQNTDIINELKKYNEFIEKQTDKTEDKQIIHNIKIAYTSDEVTITSWVGNDGQSFIFRSKKNKIKYIKEILNFDFNSMTKEYFYLMLEKIKKLCLKKYDVFPCDYSFNEIVPG